MLVVHHGFQTLSLMGPKSLQALTHSLHALALFSMTSVSDGQEVLRLQDSILELEWALALSQEAILESVVSQSWTELTTIYILFWSKLNIGLRSNSGLVSCLMHEWILFYIYYYIWRWWGAGQGFLFCASVAKGTIYSAAYYVLSTCLIRLDSWISFLNSSVTLVIKIQCMVLCLLNWRPWLMGLRCPN